MLDLIRQQINNITDHDHQIYRVREIVQLIILSSLGTHGFFSSCCFVGGTALRICFGLQRYSEDLDFSLQDAQHRDEHYWQKLTSSLELRGLPCETTIKEGTISSCVFKFPTLLYDLRLSPYETQKIHIKCEVDTCPPHGAERETSAINDITLFPVTVYTLPSLMSGKIHAILQRGFVKGRDRYDLVWYLTKGITPNMPFLTNALLQTGYTTPLHSWHDIVQALLILLDTITTSQLLKDVGVFLENKQQQALLDVQFIRSLLEKSTHSVIGPSTKRNSLL